MSAPSPAGEAHPSCTGWIVEVREAGRWMFVSSGYTDKAEARARLAQRRERFPRWEHRLVRKTTTYTVEEA